MSAETPSILQIFNRYLERGGEEISVDKVAEIMNGRCKFAECIFDSAEWKGAGAPPALKQLLRMFNNPVAVQRLRQQQEKYHYQTWLVHNIYPVGSPAVYEEALRQRIPIVQFIHNFRPFSITGYLDHAQALAARHWLGIYFRQIAEGAWQKSRLKTFALGCVLSSVHFRNQLRAVKAWVAISDFMRTTFIDAGVPAEKIFRLYWPRDLVNVEANFGEQDYYLFLGRLIEDKGIKVLIECWNILYQRLGKATPRLLVAGGGPMEEWVKNAASANPRVQYCGFVQGAEKHRLVSGCRAMVQPSIWAEPLSLVIYDAFDYGKPVLAAASGGMPELVGESNGLIHQRGNASQLASQVEQLERLGDAVRRDMGQSGRKWLVANTSVDAWVTRLFQIVRYAQQTGMSA